MAWFVLAIIVLAFVGVFFRDERREEQERENNK